MKRTKLFLMMILVSCVSFAQSNLYYDFEKSEVENELYWTTNNESTHSLELTSTSLNINLSQGIEKFDGVSITGWVEEPVIEQKIFDFRDSKKMTARIKNNSDSLLKISIVPIDSFGNVIYATKEALISNFWDHEISWIIEPHTTKFIKNYDFEGALVMDWNKQKLSDTFRWDKVASVFFMVTNTTPLDFELNNIEIEVDLFTFGFPIDDEDNDGVVDEADSCLGTSAGVDVDVYGCEIVRFSTFKEDFTKTEFQNGFYWSGASDTYDFVRTQSGLLVDIDQKAEGFTPLVFTPGAINNELQDGDFKSEKFLSAKITNLGDQTLHVTIAPIDNEDRIIYASSKVFSDENNWFDYEISWRLKPGESLNIKNYDFEGSARMDWTLTNPKPYDDFNWDKVRSLLVTFRNPFYTDPAHNQRVLIEELVFGMPTDSLVDFDNDGVADDKDKCPNTPTGVDVDQTGCAVVTSLEDLIVSDLVYPNPFTSSLTINFEGVYTLKDVQGKIVAKGFVKNETIDVSALTNGLYTLSLQNDTQSVSLKLMK